MIGENADKAKMLVNTKPCIRAPKNPLMAPPTAPAIMIYGMVRLYRSIIPYTIGSVTPAKMPESAAGPAEQQYGTDKDDPWEVCFVHFNAVDPLLSMWKLDNTTFFRFAGIQQVQRIFSSMFELMETFRTGNEPHLSALVYELLLFLLKNSESLKQNNTLDQKEVIHGIADKIHDKPGFHWTSEHMAELSGYSLYYFIRLFQKIMGMKPNEYIKMSRISAAKNLLVATDLPIYEIAENVGFSSTSYFIKVFREAIETSPQVYRNIYKQS